MIHKNHGIYLIIFFIIIYIVYNYFNREQFDTIDLLNHEIKANKNIFVGLDTYEGGKLKKKIKDSENKFNIKTEKSNIFLISDFDKGETPFSLDNLYINNQYIDKYKFNNFFRDYKNTSVQYKDKSGNQVLYNHEDKQNNIDPPYQLCINNNCINRKNISVLNGKNTIKLKSNNKYLQPYDIHFGGDGKLFSSEECTDCRNKQLTLYGFHDLEDKSNCKFNINLDKTDVPEVNMFKYFALKSKITNKYLSVKGPLIFFNGDKITSNNEIFYVSNQSEFRKFITSYTSTTTRNIPLGIINLSTKTYLQNTKRKKCWGGISFICNKVCSNPANFSGNHVGDWENMQFQRVNTSNKNDLSVRIVATSCGRYLSVHDDNKSTVEFSRSIADSEFLIVPIYSSCSEDCKADYNTNYSCKAPYCEGSNEKNIPKKYQCPIDRPKCRFYHRNMLGKCFKEEVNTPDSNMFSYNQKIPHIVKCSKPEIKDYDTTKSGNKPFYNEFSLSIAKNKKDQLYETDNYIHIHEHKNN